MQKKCHVWLTAVESQKRYKDCPKKSLNVCHIDCLQWSDMAADRDAWRHTVHKAALKRTGETPSKTNDRGEKLKLLPPPKTQTWTYMCRHCTRTCLSRVGLLSHARTGLESAWTTTFLIFVRAARINNPFPFVKIPWIFASFYFDGNKYLHKTR